MEQGCPHCSILPHIFPDCNSFAIKIEGKFCGVRGVCPGGAARLGVAGSAGVSDTRRGGAGGGSRPPTLPLVLLLPPSPRPALAERSSRREWGDYRLFYARGFAPCIPGAERGAALVRPAAVENSMGGLPRRCRRGGRQRYPAGGLPALSPACPATAVPAGGACLLCRLLTLPLTCFLAPISPTPFPAGRG